MKLAEPVVPAAVWTEGWSGAHAEVGRGDANTPDGEPALRVTWTRAEAESLPTISRSFEARALEGDVVAFWLRVDQPVAFLQVLLTDGDDVGAETGVASLLGRDAVPAEEWRYVVWPFRVRPGWVRYKRGRVDWSHVKGIGFYTRPDQLHPKLALDAGPFHVLSYAQLEAIFQQHPERVCGNRSVPWRVLSDDRAGRMIDDYHRKRAEERVAALRARVPAERFARSSARIRKALAATYRMPPSEGAPRPQVLRTVTVDGIAVEHRLLRVREGVYSTSLVFLPPGGGRRPAILMLPGHGDPSWSPAVQSRCLAFAKRGYVVMLVQPFGQNERGEQSLWNEGHGAGATAFLLATGQSLLGLIMADHQAELTDLCARPDVDPKRVAVTGVSMGGTHTLWFAAIDTRVRAAAAVAVAPLTRPVTSLRHHCLCDLMIGLYGVADEEMIQALSAPRALLRLYPGGEAPLSDEGVRLNSEGWLGLEEALKRYGMDDAALRERHRYAHEAYRSAGAEDAFAARVIAGPHDYTPAMREVAAEWFVRHLDDRGRETGDGRTSPAPVSGLQSPVGSREAGDGGAPAPVSSPPASLSIPEPALTPVTPQRDAVAVLNFWPQGGRPKEILSPTAYVQREIGRLVARLPDAPGSIEEWRKARVRLQGDVRRLLGVPLASPEASTSEVGMARAETAGIRKLVVRPEADIVLPMLLFEPAQGASPGGKLAVLLHPQGMLATAGSDERQRLTREGAWVLCVDLRGMGETRYDAESGGYLGFRDLDTCMGALKLGHTLAGYWAKDLLAAIEAARRVVGGRPNVLVRAELETGLVAILAAGQSPVVGSVETRGLLASYVSARGYGLPFAYSDESNNSAARNRPLGGYGSMLPCIPDILKHADIPQLAALVAPRHLVLAEARWASGDPLSPPEAEKAFTWPRAIYRLHGAEGALQVTAEP